jgi:betaine-aldehyde dehydrogenase
MAAKTPTVRPLPKLSEALPQQRSLYYDGRWQEPAGGYLDTWNPGTGESLGPSAQANTADVDAAARAPPRCLSDLQSGRPHDRGARGKQRAPRQRADPQGHARRDAPGGGKHVGAKVSACDHWAAKQGL